MNLSLIKDAHSFFQGFEYGWCVSGGWAIDLFLGRNTRERSDLDVSVFNPGHRASVDFILSRDWIVEGKKGSGFKRISSLQDLDADIRYFWSFPRGADFISEYVDSEGNRRISYNRSEQFKMDYVEVFFNTFENDEFVFCRNERVRRSSDRAVLSVNGFAFLAPEMVLLYKSNRIRPNDEHDFQSAISEMSREQRGWLLRALKTEYGQEHAWMRQLENA